MIEIRVAKERVEGFVTHVQPVEYGPFVVAYSFEKVKEAINFLEAIDKLFWIKTKGEIPHEWLMKPTVNGYARDEKGFYTYYFNSEQDAKDFAYAYMRQVW